MKKLALALITLFAVRAHAVDAMAFPSSPIQESGSLTVTLSGPFTTAQTGKVIQWYRNGNMATLLVPSTSAACTVGGMDGIVANGAGDILTAVDLKPSVTIVNVSGRVQDNGAYIATPGLIQIGSDGSLALRKDGAYTSFNSSGANCGFAAFSVTYLLN